MLVSLTICNLKQFEKVEIELGNPVVFIGPNNSGKTTALQALALWDVGLRKWNEKRKSKGTPAKRLGVTINRRDLIAVPTPGAKLLWRNLHVRDVFKAEGKQQTHNVRIDIVVKGVSETQQWKCGLEFDYANDESLYCRPLRLKESKSPPRMAIPDEASKIRVAHLPPMSGLAANERRLDPGAIDVLIGEGRTAEVLRNLCYRIFENGEGEERWAKLCKQMTELFGVEINRPEYIAERGEIEMSYCEPSGLRLDISSSGRGLQQTLLLLAHLYANPGTVLLLDEPDAHLEILRQRQIYQVLTEAAQTHDSQIIIASHSEVILNEAADRDVVVAFVGSPHRIDDRGSQVVKSLKEIGFEDYYQAEQTGFVLYLEGSTDLAILRAFSEKLGHEASKVLERPFVHYVENLPQRAREHFYGLRESKGDLVGFGLFDRLDKELEDTSELALRMWARREIENYLCQVETLLAYAEFSGKAAAAGPLFDEPEAQHRRKTMQECVEDLVPKAAIRDPQDLWWLNTKVSDDFLDRLFSDFFRKLDLPNLMRKTDYHVLARFVPEGLIEDDVRETLDEIVRMNQKARPVLME